MPIRRVVIDDAEVRPAGEFQIISQAGVAHGEIVIGKIRTRRIGRDERRIGIAEYLADVVVLHHDDENMVKMANSLDS